MPERVEGLPSPDQVVYGRLYAETRAFRRLKVILERITTTKRAQQSCSEVAEIVASVGIDLENAETADYAFALIVPSTLSPSVSYAHGTVSYKGEIYVACTAARSISLTPLHSLPVSAIGTPWNPSTQPVQSIKKQLQVVLQPQLVYEIPMSTYIVDSTAAEGIGVRSRALPDPANMISQAHPTSTSILQRISMEFFADFLQVGSVATIGVSIEGGSRGTEITSIDSFIEERITFEDLQGANFSSISSLVPLVRLLDHPTDAAAPWSTRRICRMPSDAVLCPSTRSSNKDNLAGAKHNIVTKVTYRLPGRMNTETCTIEKRIQIASVSAGRSSCAHQLLLTPLSLSQCLCPSEGFELPIYDAVEPTNIHTQTMCACKHSFMSLVNNSGCMDAAALTTQGLSTSLPPVKSARIAA